MTIKCDKCRITYYSNNSTCKRCINNPTHKDHFEERVYLLNSLFDGAPVVVGNSLTDIKHNRIWHHEEHCYLLGELPWGNGRKKFKSWKFIRLPSIEESPMNMWLAPQFEFPEELIGSNLFVMYKNGVIDVFGNLKLINWDKVKKFMIIE